MPGPALPVIVAGGLAAARGARSLYRAGRAAKPFIRKEIKDFQKDAPGMLPVSGAAAAYGTIDAVSGGKAGDKLSKLPKKIARGSQSQISNFSRKLIDKKK